MNQNIYFLLKTIETALTYRFLYLQAVNILGFEAAELQREIPDVRQRLFCGAAVRRGPVHRAHLTLRFLGVATEDHGGPGVHR